ncbi:outer membrane lipoprotein chaperone LolA [Halorhodospira halochloris]|nr:outer membrane lipoprotein chaperone LolA [Halorhodospira halochloris]MCG5548574.1 outer membrane lipoprotein chaperone LolA [Halorhodospira halochloris]
MMVRSLMAFMAAFVIGGAASADMLQGLEDYYDNVKTLQGGFEQQTLDERNRVVDSSSGEFAISRPDRFHWSYAAPFSQEIVADGEKLWIYDVDLDQVTVRNQAEVLGSAPAQLLSGDYDDLTQAFEIEAGDKFVRLTPKEGGQAFDEARIGLRDGYPFALEIDDALGQTTRVELLDVIVDEDIDEQRFIFEPPEGVDVYEADEGEALR